MLVHHKLQAAALFIGLVVSSVWLAVSAINALASGPNYCAMVKEAKCSSQRGGDWVLVTAGNHTYVVLMRGDKDVSVQQIQ